MASADRYSRQMMIPELGPAGQARLANSTVGIMGVGGLGCPASLYLAAAGVGRLILADPQSPDVTNLNRQVLHWDEDVGTRSKPESAAWKLRRMNPLVEVEACPVKVTGDNIATVFGGADVILDCLDSFPPRHVLNEHCVRTGTPFVHAAVEGLHGQLTVVRPGSTPCLRCLFPADPPQRSAFPILGATAGVFGTMQAAEAVKVLTGIGQPLASKLLVGDLQHNDWEVIGLSPAERCPVCGRP